MTAISGMECGDGCASAQKSGAVWDSLKRAGRFAGSLILFGGLMTVFDMATGKAPLENHISHLQSEIYHLDKAANGSANTCYYFNSAVSKAVSFRPFSISDDTPIALGELPTLNSASCAALRDESKMTLEQAREATAQAVGAFTASLQVQGALKTKAHADGFIELKDIPATPASGPR